MATKNKIVSETFVDRNGKVVKDAKDAVRIEVIEELPDGRHETTILTSDPSR